MRLTIVAVGSRGDIYPYARLGVELRDRGYDVRFATHRAFRPLAQGLGLEFAPIAGDPRELLESEEGISWVESGANPVAYIRRLRRLVGPILTAIGDDIVSACAGADAVVYYAHLGALTLDAAEKLALPALEVSTHPMSRTRAFAAIGALDLGVGRLTGAYNLLTHLVSEQANWQPFRRQTNDWRRGALGLGPAPVLGPRAAASRARRPIVYAYSPILLPRPADWGSWVHVTGFWFLDEPAWEPPPELVCFLAAGSPPVVIGFGSMRPRDPGALTDTVVSAVRASRRRAVLLGGWSGMRTAHPGDDIFQIDYAPHAWLYPHAAAAVHHGGLGTLGAVLRAGTPSVAIPFFADQLFWGKQLARIGAGPPPIQRKALSPGALAAAIRHLTDDAALRSRTAALGVRVRAEDGIERGLAAVCAFLQESSGRRSGG